MRIAITGASGFIGKQLLEKFDRENRIASRGKTTAPETGGNNGESHTMVLLSRSNTDYSVENLAVQLEGVDAVVHLAAVRGTAGTLADYTDNMVITENLLLAMGQAGVKRMVFASSIAVYSDTDRIPWTEDMALEPKTLYGITKATCENLCGYYGRKFGFSISIIRIAQGLGQGETTRRGMMNVFMDTAAEGGQIRVMGRSCAKRQFVYVKDVANVLYAQALRTDGKSEILNLGMGQAYTNLEIAQAVNRVFGNERPIDYDDSIEETIESSNMDISRLRESMGYEPASLEQALEDIKEEYF